MKINQGAINVASILGRYHSNTLIAPSLDPCCVFNTRVQTIELLAKLTYVLPYFSQNFFCLISFSISVT